MKTRFIRSVNFFLMSLCQHFPNEFTRFKSSSIQNDNHLVNDGIYGKIDDKAGAVNQDRIHLHSTGRLNSRELDSGYGLRFLVLMN